MSWIIALIVATVLILLLTLSTAIVFWSWILVLLSVVIIGGSLIALTEKYERKYLEKAGYGIKVLAKSGAKVEGNRAVLTLPDREVVANVVRTSRFTPGGHSLHFTDVTYTQIRVEHRGKIPCIIQLPVNKIKRISFFDKDVYMEWKNQYAQSQFQLMPEKVKINGREVLSALPDEATPKIAEQAERILNDPNLAELEGLITIEPDQVWWSRRKDLLPQELLEKAVRVLVGVAEKVEREYSLWVLER